MSTDDRDARRAALLQGLRDLPERKAPATLEIRVLEELARRAAKPWWRRSYVAWPAAARAAFLLLSAALIVAPFLDGFDARVRSGVLDAVVQRCSLWVTPALVTLSALTAPARLATRGMPAAWIDLLLAGTAFLYCFLFGISVAAYHVLSIQPSRTWGDQS